MERLGDRVLIILTLVGCVNSINIKIVSMYGKFTSRDDMFKQIMTDAATYVNDGNLLAQGDQINVIHNNVLGNTQYENRTLFQSVYQVCNDVRNTGAAGLILPNDFCANGCDQLGSIIGEAYSPVIALDQADGSRAFKMVPNLKDMVEMLTAVISNFKWQSFLFLYEGDTAFGLGEMLAEESIMYNWQITSMEIQADLFHEQTDSIRSRRVKNILVYVTNEEVLKEIVDVAFETQLLSNGWHWIFGNLNPPISQPFLEQKYRHNMAFLTRFKVESNDLRYFTSTPNPIKNWQFRQRAAYDAVVALASALKMAKEETGNLPDPIELCSDIEKSGLDPYLKRVNFRGASGDVSFNEHGDRVNYTIIMYSGKDQYTGNVAGMFVQDIVSWERANSKEWPGQRNKRMYIGPFRQSNADFIKVLMVTEPPFFFDSSEEARRYGSSISQSTGEQVQLGISWELLQEIKKLFDEEMGIPFDFKVFTMNRGQYGSLDLSTGEWDGAMRELIDGDADIIMGSLTVNDAREKDIDFTVPWYVSNAKLLLIHPTFTFEYPFVLVYPLSHASWWCLLAIFTLISCLAWLIGRFDPYEWRKRARRDIASREEGKTFTIPEAFLFVLSTGFWQGYIKGPRSWSFRILAVFWFWFAISLTFLYLWSLNTVFKFSKTSLKVQDQTDLLMQDQFEFGVVRDSPTYDLYRYGDAIEREIFDRILNSEVDLIETRIEDAVLRMREQWNGRYTLLGEERILEYAALRRPCQLYITGSHIGNVTFAFATASGSPLRDQMTYAINTLRNRGVIEGIVNRSYSDNLQCAESGVFKESSKKSFTVHDFQGIYYIMLIGIGSSLIVFILECVFYLLWKHDGPIHTPLDRMGRNGRSGERGTAAETTGMNPASGGDWL